MSGWFMTFLVGMTMPFVFVGLMMLLYRYIVKRTRAEREEERRRRRYFDWKEDQ